MRDNPRNPNPPNKQIKRVDMQEIENNFDKSKASGPPMRWFRMYSEFATDPKVQMLSESDQRRYLMLLCLRCCNGDVTLQDAECAFQLRISETDYAATKAVLIARGLIDEANHPTAWDRRQYVSDTSKQRVSKHREKKKHAPQPACNVTVTPPESDTDTDSDTKQIEQAAAPTQEPARPEPSVAALPHLVDRLIEACNGSLDNPVNCMGLLSEATPQMWLDRGADLERDVIPTLQAAGKKYHGKRIRDWNYFTGMIADAVEKRKAELPAATPQKQTTSYSIGAKIKAYNERMKSEGAANV